MASRILGTASVKVEASTSARAITCSAVSRRSANPLPLSARAWGVMVRRWRL